MYLTGNWPMKGKIFIETHIWVYHYSDSAKFDLQ